MHKVKSESLGFNINCLKQVNENLSEIKENIEAKHESLYQRFLKKTKKVLIEICLIFFKQWKSMH